MNLIFAPHIRPRSLLFATFFLVIYFFSWPWPFPETRGRLAAKFDLAVGNHKILAAGMPVFWRPEYAQLLKTRYGIEYRQVALCIVSESEIAYVRAYDDVSEAAATRRFHRDVVKQCYEEARNHWEQNWARAMRLNSFRFPIF
jgi:hypothetical protein